MALDYDSKNTGIFHRIQVLRVAIAAHDNNIKAGGTLDLELLAIVNPFEAADKTEQVLDLYNRYPAMIAEQKQLRNNLADHAAKVFDDDSILDELRLQVYNQTEFFPVFYNRMVADSETIKKSARTIGSVTPDLVSTSDMKVVVTDQLDGNSAAVRGGIVIPAYGESKTVSELTVPGEKFTIACKQDKGGGGTEFAERFTWGGDIAPARWSYEEGSGAGPSLQVSGSISTPSNPYFTTKSSDGLYPAGWTTASKSPQLVMVDDVGVKLNRASGTLPSLTRVISLSPRRLYCAAMMVHTDTVNGSAVGNVMATFTATGWTPGATEKISVPLSTLTLEASRVVHTCNFLSPKDANEVTLTLKLDSVTTDMNVIVTMLKIIPFTYFGGHGVALIEGDIPSQIGDTYEYTITGPATPGLNQEFFRRWKGIQLPSSDTPTISEAIS